MPTPAIYPSLRIWVMTPMSDLGLGQLPSVGDYTTEWAPEADIGDAVSLVGEAAVGVAVDKGTLDQRLP